MPKFHFLATDGMTKIDGHKYPHCDTPIIKYDPDKVYIQAVDNKGLPLSEMVKVNDTVCVGTVLGIRNDFNLPVYSSVSGKVVAIEKKTSTTVGRLVDHFVIENDKKYTKVNLPKLTSRTKEAVVDLLKKGSIVGLGGAGFPTFIKYNVKPGTVIDTILVNAVECEPYLTTDYVEGARSVNDMFYALPILMEIVEAKQAIIACKENKKHLIDAIKNAINEHKEVNAKLVLVKDRYPMGFERTLIREVLKREYEVLPSECHVIENNIQTLEAAGRLFRDGEVITRRVITIAGEAVATPNNYDVPVGTMLNDIVVNNGGYSCEEVKVINGGPMCGKAVLTTEIPVLLQTGGFTILHRYDIKAEPCWKCGACVDHCPMGLQPVQIQMAINRGDVERCHDLQVEKCVECGLCSFVCPSHIDVSANVSKAKLMARLKFKPGVKSQKEEQREKIKALLQKFKDLFKKKTPEEKKLIEEKKKEAKKAKLASKQQKQEVKQTEKEGN